jgi:hypothetical protein
MIPCKQTLMVVGSMQVDEQIAKGPQQGQGAGGAIDELAAGSFGGHGPFQKKPPLLARLDTGFFKFSLEAFVSHPFKDRFDRAGCCSRSNQSPVRAFTEQEIQSADQHTFAGTGFTGDGRESGTWFPMDFFDESKITNT